MNRFLAPGVGSLVLLLGITGCASPFSRPPSQPVTRAPVIDRNIRQGQVPAYPTQPSIPLAPAQVEVGQLPREDLLTPREYASPNSDAYGIAPSNPPPGAIYPSPAYPPGAAYPPDDFSSNAAQNPDGFYGAAPAPEALPPPQPVAQPPAPPPEEPTEETVALATPPAPEPATPPPAPARQRPAPPPRPAELPPAEITREGNQAVVALLDSADKYVKSNQLGKAGAALERALRIEPRNAGIWHDLAQIRLHQGQYQQAESLASKSNNLARSNRSLQARNWKLISVARQASGNTAGAEEAEAQASVLSR